MPITSSHKGYDSNATKKKALRPNAQLTFGQEKVNLWVYEVTTGWKMAGSTAQSSLTRTFFAHNFQQPSFTIACQFPSQQHMALVADFVRKAHKALESSMILEISSASPVPNGNRRLKGVSKAIRAEGYVASFSRVHERHVYAPDVTFDFVVERIDSPGDWADSTVTIRRLKSWHDIVQGVMAHDPNAGFTDDPDGESNKSPEPVVLPDIVNGG
jgi:hypothetical protein